MDQNRNQSANNTQGEHGCDFQTIAGKMNKTRDQIKRKFKVLEKNDSRLTDVIFSSKATNGRE